MRKFTIAWTLAVVALCSNAAEAAQPPQAAELELYLDHPAQAQGPKEDWAHTVTWWCVDLNALWKTDVPVIAARGTLTTPVPSPLPACAEKSTFPIVVRGGSRFEASGTAVWWVMKTYAPAVRAGLEAAGYRFVSNSPAEDLLRKTVEVRTVVWTLGFGEVVASYSFDPRKVADVVQLGDFLGDQPWGPYEDPSLGLFVSEAEFRRTPVIHFGGEAGPLPAELPAGRYIVETVWVLGDTHCDGFGLSQVPGENCLPPGELTMGLTTFQYEP